MLSLEIWFDGSASHGVCFFFFFCGKFRISEWASDAIKKKNKNTNWNTTNSHSLDNGKC